MPLACEVLSPWKRGVGEIAVAVLATTRPAACSVPSPRLSRCCTPVIAAAARVTQFTQLGPPIAHLAFLTVSIARQLHKCFCRQSLRSSLEEISFVKPSRGDVRKWEPHKPCSREAVVAPWLWPLHLEGSPAGSGVGFLHPRGSLGRICWTPRAPGWRAGLGTGPTPPSGTVVERTQVSQCHMRPTLYLQTRAMPALIPRTGLRRGRAVPLAVTPRAEMLLL